MKLIREQHRTHNPVTRRREASACDPVDSGGSLDDERVTTIQVGADRLALDDEEDVPWLRWALAGGHLMPHEVL